MKHASYRHFLAPDWRRLAVSNLYPRSRRTPAGECVAQTSQLLRQGTRKAHLDGRHRMRETEHRRVQGLPGERCEAGLGFGGEPRCFALETRGIDGVAQHRMADMRHVGADLMGSARLQRDEIRLASPAKLSISRQWVSARRPRPAGTTAIFWREVA